MPQVYVILGPEVNVSLQNGTYYLSFQDTLNQIIKATERIFEVPHIENDVAITVVNSIFTINEAEIQVEVRYTAGKDEYKKGKPFNPSENQQIKLAQQISKFMRKAFMNRYTVSVWIKPYYKSVFICNM